jgi:hypothetical protein
MKKEDKLTDLFIKATENNEWSTIDELVDALNKVPEFWARAISADSTLKLQKQIARQFIKQRKDENGIPLYASIQKEDENGNLVRVYKQEALFDLSDYVQTADFHGKQVVHHAKMAAHYADGYKKITGKQMLLPFNEKAILLD